MNNIDGWINIYKNKDITSFDVIRKIKKNFKISKIGHAGTLDPNAEGILPIALGKNTKLIPLISDQRKIYEFEIKWGEQTTTDDHKGEILDISNNIPTKKTIYENKKFFIGEILQKPPKVSAVKINGERAYKRFMKDENFETREKKVTVFKLNLLSQPKKNISKMLIECSKGFYVRSFARDFGEFLNTKAHIFSLKRTKVGKFTEKNSILLDDLLKMRQMAIGIKGFHSSLSVLDDIPAFEIDDRKMLKDISYGKKVKVDLLFKTTLTKKNHQEYLATFKGQVISLGALEGNFFQPRKVLI
tara:strand:- start:5378 stop:6280 length:903 start_codon:yes stop_codon:yes gene_type:complete